MRSWPCIHKGLYSHRNRYNRRLNSLVAVTKSNNQNGWSVWVKNREREGTSKEGGSKHEWTKQNGKRWQTVTKRSKQQKAKRDLGLDDITFTDETGCGLIVVPNIQKKIKKKNTDATQVTACFFFLSFFFFRGNRQGTQGRILRGKKKKIRETKKEEGRVVRGTEKGKTSPGWTASSNWWLFFWYVGSWFGQKHRKILIRHGKLDKSKSTQCRSNMRATIQRWSRIHWCFKGGPSFSSTRILLPGKYYTPLSLQLSSQRGYSRWWLQHGPTSPALDSSTGL